MINNINNSNNSNKISNYENLNCNISNINNNYIYYLNNLYEKKTIPNIIFYGINQSGKKTVLENFLKLIYKTNDNIKKYALIINCAHGKGNIKFIRETLKYFANFSINSIKLDNNISQYTFKSIILLNADRLTIDAQSALRRCIEIYSKNTRFFIVVENKHKILKPILSRFSHIYFNKKIKFIENKIFKKKLISLTKLIENYDNNNNNINLINILDLTNKIYNNGYSSELLIEFLNIKLSDNLLKYKLLLILNNYKFYFKNDKLVILFCLNYFYFRNNDCLENIKVY